MKFISNHARLLCAAALLALPAASLAQDNANTAVAVDTVATNDSMADPALGTADGFNDTVANDLALANTVEPERDDDDDFPWGLLGLLGLAGLLGRKRADDIHVDARTRRDV